MTRFLAFFRRNRDSSCPREVWPATPENENAASQQKSEPITINDTGSSSASQSHKHGHQHGSARSRQGGVRNRNRQQRGAATVSGGQKQRGDAK